MRCRVAFLSLVFLGAMPSLAKVPEGVLHCVPKNQAGCDVFWNRQKEAGKKFILSYSARDRNAALTCYALHGFGEITKALRDCTHSLIGDRRSMAYCEDKGHELMSDSMEKCRNRYRRKNGYPLSY